MPELLFKGKEFVYNHHLSVPFRPLVPDPAKSIGDARLDGNLIIHGDNLHALKALLPMYAGKVDCIFIDPPYNTGFEGWSYSDNVNAPMIREWLNSNPITIEDGLRHDKWCVMMWPRMQMLRNLMSEDGFIFVCIDNNETHHLRMMMDEIFGAENFRNEIIIRRGVKNVQSQFEDIDSLSTGHDTLLLYSKNSNTRLPKLMNVSEQDEPGKWDTFWRGTDRPTMRYELFGRTPETGQWRWKKSRALEAKRNYEEYASEFADHMSLDEYYYLRTQELGSPCDFLRLSDDGVVQYYVAPRNYKLMSDVWMRIPTAGRYTDFEHEKNVELVGEAIRWVTKSDAIVLDSFAGSGTTGHAVLRENERDEGRRRFVLVEMEDYADTLTIPRISRAVRDVGGTEEQSENRVCYTYCTLGEPLELDKLLTGSDLPPYGALAAVLFHMAANRAFEPAQMEPDPLGFEGLGLLGSTGAFDVWLLYKPDLDFLKSAEAALTLSKAEAIAAYRPDTRHVVYAPSRFVSQRMLNDAGLTVEFVPLPYALYRIQGS